MHAAHLLPTHRRDNSDILEHPTQFVCSST